MGARVAKLEIARTAPRAVLLTGSSAIGESDHNSDVDLILYHDELPGYRVLGVLAGLNCVYFSHFQFERALVRVHLPAASIPQLRRPPGSRHAAWGG